MKITWLKIFKIWVILIIMSIVVVPVSMTTATYLALIQAAIPIIISSYEYRKNTAIAVILITAFVFLSIFPVIWLLTAPVIALLSIGALSELIDEKILMVSGAETLLAMIAIHEHPETLTPTPETLMLTAALLVAAAAVQKYVPVKIDEYIGIGDPRKGRLQDWTGRTVPWNDKWPRVIDVIKRPPKTTENLLAPVYFNGQTICEQSELCPVTEKINIYRPEINTKQGTMSFMTVLNNKIVRITQPSLDVSWIAKGQKPSLGTKIEELIKINNLNTKYITGTGDSITIGTDHMKIKYSYGSDVVEISGKNEKLEIPVEEWNNSDLEELEDFLVF